MQYGGDGDQDDQHLKMARALRELRLCAFEAVEIFNHYCPVPDQVTLLVHEEPPSYELRGLMLLRYSTQIRLVIHEASGLEMSLISLRGFDQNPLAKTLFILEDDELGHTIWRAHHGQLWDDEQLMKCVLKELVRHAKSDDEAYSSRFVRTSSR